MLLCQTSHNKPEKEQKAIGYIVKKKPQNQVNQVAPIYSSDKNEKDDLFFIETVEEPNEISSIRKRSTVQFQFTVMKRN